jgi:hypothetical protein
MAEDAMNDSENTRLRAHVRWVENNPVLSLVLLGALVAAFLFSVANDAFDIVEKATGFGPEPRPAIPQPLPGYINPSQLVATGDRIEVAGSGTGVVILTQDGEDVVRFTYEGMDSIDLAGNPKAPVLVAEVAVKVKNRSVGGDVLNYYFDVRSVYDRALINTTNRRGVLRLVEGDVITLMGEHVFVVNRVWHTELYGREIGNDLVSLALVPAR